jgi:hypothetical protein
MLLVYLAFARGLGHEVVKEYGHRHLEERPVHYEYLFRV